MGMDITLDINGLLGYLNKLGINIQRTIIQKNIIQFEKDLYFNLNIFRSLYRNKNLCKMLVNDPYIKKELAKVKTAVMETVGNWRYLYGDIHDKKSKDFFINLSIVLFKINELKELNAMTAKQLKNRQCRIAVRLKNIIKFLVKLTKNEGKATP